MNRRTALVNMVFCSVMHGLNHYLIIFFKPMYLPISDHFGLVNVAELTTRMTIIYFSYGISNFVSGLLSRRFSQKMILFFGMLLMSISTMLIAFVPADAYYIVVLLVFLMGLGGGTYHPAANTLITSCYEGKPGHAIGMLSIGAAVGFVVAPFIGEYIGAGLLGFKGLFLLSGLIGLIFDFLFVIKVKDHKRVEVPEVEYSKGKSRPLPPGKVLTMSIILMCIPVTLREVVGWSYYEITPFWVKFGFSGGLTIGLVQAMQYMPGIVTQPLTGKLCDRVGPLRMVIITFVLMGLSIALFAVPLPIVLWIALISFGIGATSSVVASETYMATLANFRDRPMVYGVCLSVGLGLGGVIAGVSGWVVDLFGREAAGGYRIWFVCTGVALMASTIVYPLIERMRKRDAG